MAANERRQRGRRERVVSAALPVESCEFPEPVLPVESCEFPVPVLPVESCEFPVPVCVHVCARVVCVCVGGWVSVHVCVRGGMEVGLYVCMCIYACVVRVCTYMSVCVQVCWCVPVKQRS